MMPVREELQGVRQGWASIIRNVQQSVVGDLLNGDLFGLRRAVRRMKEDLPAADSPLESLFLRQVLLTFVDRCARQLDDRFHARYEGGECRSSPPLAREAQWLLTEHSIGTLLDGWMADYIVWFGAHHDLPVVWRAIEILHERATEPWTIAGLAREVGCCRTTLLRQFVHSFGMSPGEYLARLRVREGLRYLWTTSDTVEGAALHSGYKSCSRFHGRVRHYTGMTPAAVRALKPEIFEHMLDDCLPLTSPRVQSHWRARDRGVGLR
jgi:AraC-like DNA-binding protein